MQTGAKTNCGLKSVLFIVRGNATVPSCRFRAYQFQEPLQELGVEARYVILEKSKNPWKQLLFHLRLIPHLRKSKVVVFQKLLEPWRLFFIKLFNCNLHFDFDDAMYAGPDGAKFEKTIKAAPFVIAGNEVLAKEARRLHSDVFVVPTVITMPILNPPRLSESSDFVLSWIGTGHNLVYLEEALRAIEELLPIYPNIVLRLLTEKPELAPVRPWIKTLKWNPEAEENEFRNCDVGLMPLEDSDWCRGKCACKALQYLSYSKPVISSPVGINHELFLKENMGLLASDSGEWKKAITTLYSDIPLRLKMGKAGRYFVQEHFEIKSWAKRLSERLFAENR